MAKERESRFDFFRIGVITAFLKSVGTVPEISELEIIGSSRVARLCVTCLDNTSGSGSRDEHVLVSLRREFISERREDMSC